MFRRTHHKRTCSRKYLRTCQPKERHFLEKAHFWNSTGMHTARFDKNAYECSLKLTDKHFSLFVYASRPWYKRAVANPPDIFALASVYLDGGGVGKVVTLAQTVFEGKPNQPSDCTAATNKPGGCPCSSSLVCKSQHCYDSSCANHQVREIPIFVSLFGFLTPAAVCVYLFCLLNPLSAIWRIYPSSKWSSQWPYDGYIRHGWLTSCGRGRDSATRECFGRGSQGTIFVRSSKLSLFFPELCPFRRVFCFPRFCKIWRQTFNLWGFWFRRCLGGLFENSAPSPGIFCELRLRGLRPQVFFWKFPFFFPKQSRCYLPDRYGDPQAEQSTFVMEHRRPELKLDFRALARWSAEGQWIVVAIGTSRVRRSMVQKRKKNKEVSVWLCEGSTLHHLQTSEFWGACFRDPISLPFRTSLFSRTQMYSCRTVRLQRGESEEKQSSVTFPVLITEA